MSEENVEIVRGAWAAFMRHDNAAALGFYHPEVELHGHVDGGVYRGLEGVRDFFGEWLVAWEEFSTDVEEWVDAGDDVIAVVHDRARGRHSGAQVERRQWHVWTIRDGKLWRLRIFETKVEALEAVGLSQ
jgi:ketosteroid isomerase-like protein